MPQFPLVRWVALFWGFVTFFPIGLNYTALGLLGLAMLIQADRGDRVVRMRQAPNWWPACAFVAWTIVVLALGPRYPETASNAFHAMRIVATMALALALSRTEAVWAMRGFVMGLLACLLLVGLDQVHALPDAMVWKSIVRYGGNKSLSNAALMALGAVSLLLMMPVLAPRQRVMGALLAAGSLAVLMGVLYSRTAWLIVLLGLAAGLMHQLRQQRHRQLLALALAGSLALAAGMGVPAIKERFVLGAGEIVSAYKGEKISVVDSWGIRFRMYEETSRMVAERPLMGWGIGGWNTEWKRRVSGPLAESNMPHNDLLWMGAQAGVPGALALLLMMVAGLPAAWRRHDVSGRLGVAALLAMLLAVMTNSALRDASIGLCLWFIVMVVQRLSTEPEEVWRQLLPRGGDAARTTPPP